MATPHEKSRVTSAKTTKSPPTTTPTQTENADGSVPNKDEKLAGDDILPDDGEGNSGEVQNSKQEEEKFETYETSSDRANLGTEILTFLETGERIPLTLITSVLKEALNRVPKTSGWILENFPTNHEQLEMFESEIVDLQGKKWQRSRW